MWGSFIDKDGNRIELELMGNKDNSIQIVDHVNNFVATDYEGIENDVYYGSIKNGYINYKWYNTTTQSNAMTGDAIYLKTNMEYVTKNSKGEVMKRYPIYLCGFKSMFVEYDLCILKKNGYYCGPAGDTITQNTNINSSVVKWKYNDPGKGTYTVLDNDNYSQTTIDTPDGKRIVVNHPMDENFLKIREKNGNEINTMQFYVLFDEANSNTSESHRFSYAKDLYYCLVNSLIINSVEIVDIDDAECYAKDFIEIEHYKSGFNSTVGSYKYVDGYISVPTNVTFRECKLQSGERTSFSVNSDEVFYPRYYDGLSFGKVKPSSIPPAKYPIILQTDWINRYKNSNKFLIGDDGYLAVEITDTPYVIYNYDEIRNDITLYDINQNRLKIGAFLQNLNGCVAWGSDPITIEENVDDSFSPIITKTATIRLVTSKYLGDLLYTTKPEINVIIKKNGDVIFAGGVEPYTYTQPFSNFLEEIEINCIDILGLMQYYKYADYNRAKPRDDNEPINADHRYYNFNQDAYEVCKTGIVNTTFKRFIDLYLLNGGSGLQHYFYGGAEIDLPDFDVWYDCSKQIDSSAMPEKVFEQLSISQAYLYGDDFDDCMTVQDVLSNMLTYLNLHIKQEGDAFYIFDWDSLRGTQIVWYSYRDNVKYNHRLPKNQLSPSKYASNDTSITMGEIYNQLILTCDLDDNDEVIQSPMDEDTITSVWPTKQFYCREYLLEHKNDKSAFTTLVRNQSVPERNYTLTDWYIQVLYSKYWNFYTHDGDYLNKFEYDAYGNYINAANVLRYARNHYFTPVLLNVTKVSNPTKREDNAVEYEADRSTQLYITINGNDYINADITGTKHPTDAEIENYNSPIAEYHSPKGGTIFSPTDTETTNYLVFSGKITLIPNTYYFIFNGWFNNLDEEGIRIGMAYNNTWAKNLSYGGNSMYGRRFFDLKTPQDQPSFNSLIAEPNLILKDMHLSATDKDYKGEFFKYNLTASNLRDGDKIAKIPLIACELIIGDKRLIEYDMDQYGNSKFKWVKIGEEPTEYDKDDKQYYKITTFSLGINPKIGDFIVGTEFDMQNTVTFDMNLGDEKGIAIPIKESDNLSGELTFRILGVYNITWNDVIYRHGTWFRKKKWTDNYKELLPKLRSICISDFSCKIFSDNANLESLKDDNDLCYVSDEIISFNNIKDDLEFKFVTQPTSAECIEKGLKNAIYNNSVMVTKNGTTKPLRTIFNAITHETAKPEEMYVDQYYKEYSTVKLNMSFTAHNSGAIEFSQYYSKLLDKNFYIFNKSYNVLDNTYLVNLKEI